jgi:hypothetical protein
VFVLVLRPERPAGDRHELEGFQLVIRDDGRPHGVCLIAFTAPAIASGHWSTGISVPSLNSLRMSARACRVMPSSAWSPSFEVAFVGLRARAR